MKLAWRIVRWPVELPLQVGGREVTERVVLELRLEDARGRTGGGEAAPLPGLHVEHVDSLPALLPAARRLLADAIAAGPTGYPDLLSSLAALEAWRALPPSLRCGLEGATLDLLAAGGEPAALLGLPVGDVSPACFLSDGTVADITAELAGRGCLKAKVGRDDRQREVARLRELRHALGDAAELRLDANRAFTLDEALAFADAVRDLHPRWIEEPLRDPRELPAFATRSGLAVALDETLREPDGADFAIADGVVAWVLKPALFGVHGTLEAFRRAAAAPGRPVCVVSSSFEGPRGLTLLGVLARCAPGRPAPGLGTARWLGTALVESWTEFDEAAS
ncbi:MAG TPA: o-succinylbenzoate synthase [Candidatus Krumholzibacteria bacterium]|nr:o-succinylbenzoate synthase [Candidatus Krumholzibacteria bacterium]HPD70300.1 o-succinylbenzoate synthase [Candidatus Krumholzibacteria bacterium]HRY40000.1 o-succinylbenzoate synthase [Candidatus Krumholzibacteria bacterium]